MTVERAFLLELEFRANGEARKRNRWQTQCQQYKGRCLERGGPANRGLDVAYNFFFFFFWLLLVMRMHRSVRTSVGLQIASIHNSPKGDTKPSDHR